MLSQHAPIEYLILSFCRVLGRRRVVAECGSSLKVVCLNLLKSRLSRIEWSVTPRRVERPTTQDITPDDFEYESHDLEVGAGPRWRAPTEVSSLLERESL